MKNIFLSFACFSFLALPVLGQDDVRKLLQEVEKRKDETPASVIRDIAKIGTPEAWLALRKSIGIFKQPSKLSVAYRSFKHFNGKGDLERRSIACLLEEADSQKVSVAWLAVSGLQGLMPGAELDLLNLVETHEDPLCRAIALKPIIGYVQRNRTADNLMMLLDNFRPKKSGKSSVFVDTVKLFDIDGHREILKERLLDGGYSDLMKLLILEVLRGDKIQELESLVLPCLDSDNPSVALSALRVVQGHSLSIDRLTLIGLGKHKDSGVRMTALVIEAQTTEGLVKREKKIARWTKSRDPVQRQAAANSYGLLPADVCVPGLQRLARDDAFAVRHDALGALYRLRHPLALEVLIKVLGHGDRMTRDLAQRLLVGLTGERFGQSERTWSRWWIDHRVGFVFPGEKEVDRRLHEFKRKSSEGETAAAFFGLPVISQHVAFVLDTSSSMLADFSSSSRYGGAGGTRLSAAKEQLLLALGKMPNGSWFNIFNFDINGMAWKKSLVKLSSRTRMEAEDHIEALVSRGATAMFDALELAFEDSEVDTIFLLSDGVPAGGKIDDPDLIVHEVNRWNMTRRIPIHCISIGGPTDLLETIARETAGRFSRIQ